MTKKKNSFGRIIFILILLLILIAGGYFGYKYYNDGKLDFDDLQSMLRGIKKDDADIQFPIAGVWYLDNLESSVEFAFESPKKVEGKVKGKLNILDNKITQAVLDYEIISDTKLKITDPNNAVAPYEFNYVYNATSQTLEITTAEGKNLYVRTAPVAKAEIAENTQEEVVVKDSVEIKKEEVLKIASIEWKTNNYSDHIILSQPTVEDGVVKGTIENYRNKRSVWTGTYESLSENKYLIILNKYADVQNGEKINERDFKGRNEILTLEPIDGGESIICNWYNEGSQYPYSTEKYIK